MGEQSSINSPNESLWIVVGLGNPGKKYSRTRHNIGFELLDQLAKELKSLTGMPARFENRDNAERADVVMGSRRVMLVKPQSFMNLSGEPVANLVGFYKVPLDNLIVVHDDIDLPLGSIRIRSEGGDGGHKGIRSIIERTGGSSFVRIKLGVGRPKELGDGEVSDWVLRPFQPAEEPELAQMLGSAGLAVKAVIEQGVKLAQNKFNIRVNKI